MNDFARTTPESFPLAGVETASSAAASQAKALVEARYIIAFRRPRDMDAVRERMVKECRRPSFAAVARYQKPIGKDKAKWPTGPSIRFIESAIRNMTNVTVETITVYDDREKRLVQVTVTDLESNVPYSQSVTVTKTIERRTKKDGDVVLRERTNSFGDKLYILEGTDEDILNKQGALISKTIRTLGQRLIPGDIVDECMDIVIETQRNADAQDPDSARRKLFDAFGSIGVRVDQLKEHLGHEASTLSPQEMQDLRELYAAIRDGETTWREVMDAREAPVASVAGIDAVKAAAASKRAKKGVDPQIGEITPGATAPDAPTQVPDWVAKRNQPRTYAQFSADMEKATDAETAGLVLDEARSLPASEYTELCAMHTKRFGGE